MIKRTNMYGLKLLILWGATLVLSFSFSSNSSFQYLPVNYESSLIEDTTTTTNGSYSFSGFFSEDILDDLLEAEELEVESDEDQLESEHKTSQLLFGFSFNNKKSFFIAHNNKNAHNRHLYLLYCSWRHFISL